MYNSDNLLDNIQFKTIVKKDATMKLSKNLFPTYKNLPENISHSLNEINTS